MDSEYLFLIGSILGLMVFLIWMLYPVRFKAMPEAKKEKRPSCPLCHAVLEKGERLRSSVIEIANIEIRTIIKGCPHCLGEKGKRKRTCPVCTKKLEANQSLIAYSDPRIDKRRLSMRGCSLCYPQGFE